RQLMRLRGRVVFCVLLLSYVVPLVSPTVILAQQQPPKPSFQASVEVTSLDATVVDDRGRPISNLTPADFNVRIDGQPRRVVSAEWIPLTAPEGKTPPPPPDGYSTNESASGGRARLMGVEHAANPA